MARPKEKATSFRPGASQPQAMSQAFENKSHQEHEKLLLKVAAGLSQDLVSLFEQELHADLIVTNGNCDVRVHHCIVQARAKHLWQESFLFPTTQGEDLNMKSLHANGVTEKEIRDFLRQLYCVTDSELLFEEFLPNIQFSSTSEQTAKVFTSSDSSTTTWHQPGPIKIDNTDIQENCSTLCNAGAKGLIENDVKGDCHHDNIIDIEKVNECVKESECDSVKEVKEKTMDETHKKDVLAEFVDTSKDVTSSNDCIANVLPVYETKDETRNEHVLVNVTSEVIDEIRTDFVADDSNKTKDETESQLDTDFIHETKQETFPESVTDIENETNLGSDGAHRINILNELSYEHSGNQSNRITNVENKAMNDHMLDMTGTKTDVEMGKGACALERESIECSERLSHRGKESEDLTSVTEEEQFISGQVCRSSSEIKESSCVSTTTTSDIQSVTVDDKNQEEAKSVSMPVAANEEANKNESNETHAQKAADMKADKHDWSDSNKDKYFVDSYRTCSSVGSDLLHLYLKKLHCDCCLSVEGVEFLAHKCILSARSPYFNAMFGGQWTESSLEVINLEGVSASAMEKVLLFFYGGVIDMISSADIFDLFVVADMYGVETMKLVLQFFLRRDMCHFFHKPCSTCIPRAPEALSLCHNFHLEELQDRVLKWISKYFMKIWCTKAFAAYSEALHQLCLAAMVKQMTELNVLDIIMDCDKLTTSLPRIKWTESILCLTTQLMDLAIEYTSSNFVKVIHAPEFLTWAKVACWKASALEEIFNSVIDSLPVDTAISVYQTLIDLKSFETMSESPEQNLLDLLDAMIKRCEKFLRTHIHLVTRSKQWSTINKSFQSQILENSSYYHLDHFPDPKPRPKKPVMFSSLIKSKQRSVSPSSSSSSSTQPQGPKRTSTSSSAGRRPPSSKEKSSRITSKTNATTENTIPQSALGNSSRLPNKEAKSLRISLRPPTKQAPKSSSGDPLTSQNAKDKESTSKGLQKDISDNSQAKGISSSNTTSINIKNPTTASLRLSTSLPSGRNSPGLGRSPPSRIPQKLPTGKAQEESVKDHGKKISFVSNIATGTEASGCNLEQGPSSLSVADELCEESLREVNVVFMSEKNADFSQAAKFESLQAERGDLLECSEGHTHADSNGATVVPSFNRNGLEPMIMRDTSLIRASSQNEFEGRRNQVSNGSQTHAVRGEENLNSVIVQQEITFVNTTQPVKVSFVVPSNKDEEQPP